MNTGGKSILAGLRFEKGAKLDKPVPCFFLKGKNLENSLGERKGISMNFNRYPVWY